MVKKVISKEVKVKRVDTNLKVKKSPTKLDLELQLQNLQEANDALEKSLRKKIELIETLMEKLKTWKNKLTIYLVKKLCYPRKHRQKLASI